MAGTTRIAGEQNAWSFVFFIPAYFLYSYNSNGAVIFMDEDSEEGSGILSLGSRTATASLRSGHSTAWSAITGLR
jgi:hypothetical protein